MKPSMLTGSAGGVLSRSEMKNIMAGARCVCDYNDCTAVLTQGSGGWHLHLNCGGEINNYTGDGSYGGTVCGGGCP